MNKKILYALNLVIAFALIGLVFWYAGKAEASDILYTEVTSVTNTTRSWATGGATGFNRFNLTSQVPDWIIDRTDWYLTNFSAPLISSADDNFIYGLIRDSTGTVLATSTNTLDFTQGAGYYSFFFDPLDLRSINTTDVRVGFQTISDGSIASKSFQIHTSGLDSIANWGYYDTQGNATSSDPVMTIYGIDYANVGVNTATRIISQDAPANGDTTSSDVVQFEFTYYNNDTDDEPVEKAGIEVRDMTGGFEYAPEETDIIASGQADFSTLMGLQENHFHLWRPYLRNASSTRIIYGQWFSFDVVGVSAPFETYIDPETGLPINASSTSFWDFLNVPTLLKTKAPTGYIYQIGQTLSELNEIGATTTPTLTMSFVSASSSMTALKNVDLFSYAIVTQLIPSGLISILRALMVATLYIGLAFGIIHHSHNMFS